MCSVFTFSEAGGHPMNEDAFEVQRHPQDERCWLCTLADGQGGRAGGGRAAKLASRKAMQAATLHPSVSRSEHKLWVTILANADAEVRDDPEAGFTTLLGFCVRDGYLRGASSGDSAVVALTGGNAEELTQFQERNPPVGSGGAQFVPFATKLPRPWTVLAMSDGVWKYVGWDRLKEASNRLSGQALIDELQGQARLKRTGQLQDDFTLVVMQDVTRE